MNGFLNRRVRGFRLIDLVAFSVLAALILGVYLAKTIAGRERTEIARIERLSEAYLGLAPAPIKHQASLDDVGDLALKPLGPAAKPVEVTPDPILTAAPQAPEPLPAPTQMAAVANSANSHLGVTR